MRIDRSPFVARNMAIVWRHRIGQPIKAIGKEFDLTPARIQQIVGNAFRVEQKRLGIPADQPWPPRKRGQPGRGYSDAASPRQRRALSEWENLAKEVAAKEWFPNDPFGHHFAKKSEVQLNKEIAEIKTAFDRMTSEAKAEHHDLLARSIDFRLKALGKLAE